MLDQLQANPLSSICYSFCTDSLFPSINVSSVTTTTATLSLSPPTNFTVAVTMYRVTLTGTTCNGVPTRTGSTTSNSVTVGSLEAGIQYSVSVTGRNNFPVILTDTGTTNLTTKELGKTVFSH